MLTLALTVGLIMGTPTIALAAFKRPFVRQMPQTAVGGELEPGGVASDASGDLWVSEPGVGKLSEFDPSGAPLQYLTFTFSPPSLQSSSTLPESLAVDFANGDFYTGGKRTREFFEPRVEVFDETGSLVERWGKFGSPAQLALDNSTNPIEDASACVLSVCTVYVAHGTINPAEEFGGDGLVRGIEKFDTGGKPVAFTASASYISGNQITGAPQGPYAGSAATPVAVAVGQHGEIYAIDENASNNKPLVDEYQASGLFVKAIGGEQTPGIGGSHENGGFGGGPQGLAVDPVNGNVVVSVYNVGQKLGAVDEFDASGEFLSQIKETLGGSHLGEVREMAFAPDGQLYVVDISAKAVDVFGPGGVLPSLTIDEASQRQSTGAHLSGSVNPEEGTLSECYFEYVAEASYDPEATDPYGAGEKAECEPAAAAIPADSSFHVVQASLSALTPGTTYRYRLVATTGGPLGGTNVSEGLAFTAPGAPTVESSSAVNISSTFAEFQAVINPHGADTQYLFEYVDDAHYSPLAEDPYAAGATAPASGAYLDIGSGEPTGGVQASVSRQVGGLLPDTSYHFRVLARNELNGTPVGAIAGPDRTFTTLPASSNGLPDHRAYELVTPPNKGSAEDMFAAPETERNSFFNNDVGYPSESGNGFLLVTRAAFGPFPAAGGNAYAITRAGGSWHSLALASTGLGVQSLNLAAFDPMDLSRVGLDTAVDSFGSASGSHEVSVAGPSGGPYTNIYTQAGSADAVRIAGASDDLSRVVVESTNHSLSPDAEGQDPGSHALYGWSGGSFELLSVDSNGVSLTQCGAVLGQGEFAGGSHNAVSPDGARVVFTAPDPYAVNVGPGCWNGGAVNPPQVYVRSQSGKTVEISAPAQGVLEEGNPPALHTAKYVGASTDASKVFFMTETEVTADVATLKLHDEELYEYDLGTEEVRHVSAGEVGSPAAQPGGGSHVFTVPAVAADGSAVYFDAFGRLTSSAPAVSGKQINLYRYDTAQHSLAYVATVSERDYPNSKAGSPFGIEAGLQSELALDPQASWYTTPNGRYLLFASESELTGYSTAQPDLSDCPVPFRKGEPHSGHCSQIYRYDSGDGAIVCLSCDPSGATPVSNAFFAQAAGGPTPSSPPVRAMSDDGSYAFFESADPLVSADGNGTLDVYEWHEGRLTLISSGQDSAPSYFLSVDPSATNVFFGTHARLVSSDTDTAGDVYDARVCTDSDPCIKPPAPPTAACEGDACQSPPPSPIDATPESLTFSGAGNAVKVVATVPKLTKAQKLSKALKACKVKRNRRRRKGCEAQARKRYGARPAKKAKNSRLRRTSQRSGR